MVQPRMKPQLRFAPIIAAAFLLAITFFPKEASAYAWMIRHGYTGCTSCHADPSGGALLTRYGRAQSELLLRTRYGSERKVQEPGSMGDFLFGAFNVPDSLLLGGDVRNLLLNVIPQNGPSMTKFIVMQADAQAEFRVDRFRVNGSLGYAHDGALAASITSGPHDRLISRTFWAGVDLGSDNQFLLRAGRMNLPFGIRSIEHTLWARTSTRTDANASQQYGVALAYGIENFRAEVMAIAGNFQARPDAFRERGYSGYAEYAPTLHSAVGVSSLVAHADRDIYSNAELLRQSHGLFARYSPVMQVVLSAEADALVQSQPSSPTLVGHTGYVQGDYEFIQGVHLIGTGEWLQAAPTRADPSVGLWGSVAWFFAPHADVRLDTIWRSAATSAARSQSTALLAQFHLFL